MGDLMSNMPVKIIEHKQYMHTYLFMSLFLYLFIYIYIYFCMYLFIDLFNYIYSCTGIYLFRNTKVVLHIYLLRVFQLF